MPTLTGSEPVSASNLAAALGAGGALSGDIGDRPISAANLKAALAAVGGGVTCLYDGAASRSVTLANPIEEYTVLLAIFDTGKNGTMYLVGSVETFKKSMTTASGNDKWVMGGLYDRFYPGGTNNQYAQFYNNNMQVTASGTSLSVDGWGTGTGFTAVYGIK